MSDERCPLDDDPDSNDSLGDIPEDMTFNDVAREILTQLRSDLHRRYCPQIGHAEWARRMSEQFAVASIATIILSTLPESTYEAAFPLIIGEVRKFLDRVNGICESVKDNGIN